MLRRMKLHSYFRSSAAFRVRIALELKALAYDYIAVNLPKGEHKTEAFAAASTNALVPLLETGGHRLSQSLAIIEYLEAAHPTPALMPATPLGQAQVRALAQTIACEIHPLNNLRVLKYLTRELEVAEEAKNTWYQHWCTAGFTTLEAQLAQVQTSAFCYGSTPGLADCCLVPQVFNAQRFKVDMTPFPRVMTAFEACMALSAFQKAQPSSCPDFEA
jgi:maleylacetoacetate isomerase